MAVGAILDGAGAGVLSPVLAIGTFLASLPLLRMTVASGEAADEPQPGRVPTA
uniref:hypothetical protein n=1 Tax=Streptomyces capitiformicae TaxID=2014920 RepID=UPI001E298574|nr:hypothetical protein [Streptomyces capitiformicae]